MFSKTTSGMLIFSKRTELIDVLVKSLLFNDTDLITSLRLVVSIHMILNIKKATFLVLHSLCVRYQMKQGLEAKTEPQSQFAIQYRHRSDRLIVYKMQHALCRRVSEARIDSLASSGCDLQYICLCDYWRVGIFTFGQCDSCIDTVEFGCTNQELRDTTRSNHFGIANE